MKKIDLDGILADIQNVKIGIVGDFCIDAYWDINESRSETSVETMLPTRSVEFQRYSLGGAGNVAKNLHAMGVKNIKAFGVSGNDPFGHHMQALLSDHEIASDNIIVQENDWSTHTYIKPIQNDVEENRIDLGNFNSLSMGTAECLLNSVTKELPSLDLIIINQQVLSGIHNLPFFRAGLQNIINNSDSIFIVDSRHFAGEYHDAMQKINAYEAASLCGKSCSPCDSFSLSETKDYIDELYSKCLQPIFLTRGAEGCLAVDEKGLFDVPGLNIVGKIDTVGAGDSMLAGISACLAAGYQSQTAAIFGNFVAGVTVQKLFCTGTATPEEILEIGKNPVYNSGMGELRCRIHNLTG